MKSIRLVSVVLLILLFLVLFSGCKNTSESNEHISDSTENISGSHESIEDTRDEVKGFIKNRYIINDVFYQIIDLSTEEQPFGPYYYKIEMNKKVFAEGVKERTEPEIDYISTGVIRLFMGFGSNAFSLQYFDVWNDRTSEVFSPYAGYADYADSKTNECLIAYFKFPSASGKNVLLIRDIFDEHGFSVEIDRGFISATCNNIIILNENEIYLDYDVFADGYSNDDLIAGNPVEFKNIREVVKFR